jgi:hypothetical protein
MRTKNRLNCGFASRGRGLPEHLGRNRWADAENGLLQMRRAWHVTYPTFVRQGPPAVYTSRSAVGRVFPMARHGRRRSAAVGRRRVAPSRHLVACGHTAHAVLLLIEGDHSLLLLADHNDCRRDDILNSHNLGVSPSVALSGIDWHSRLSVFCPFEPLAAYPTLVCVASRNRLPRGSRRHFERRVV